MTQTELAEKAGVSVATISMILAGKRRPSPELAERLERETGIDRIHWLYPHPKGPIKHIDGRRK